MESKCGLKFDDELHVLQEAVKDVYSGVITEEYEYSGLNERSGYMILEFKDNTGKSHELVSFNKKILGENAEKIALFISDLLQND